jgi:4'-phosphopantetheinyl transferase
MTVMRAHDSTVLITPPVWQALYHAQGDGSDAYLYTCNYEHLVLRMHELQGYLLGEELEQANSYATLELKHQFVISRGLLRGLLSLYVQVPPENLVFVYNAYGKPSLKDYNIHFNLSHARQKILLAISRHMPIGADIEYCNPTRDLENLKPFLFNTSEAAWFETLKDEEKRYFFYKVWAQKEALVKAEGMGLSYPLHTIKMTDQGASRNKFFLNDHTWWCYLLSCDKDYAAAFALPRALRSAAYITIEKTQQAFDTIRYIVE